MTDRATAIRILEDPASVDVSEQEDALLEAIALDRRQIETCRDPKTLTDLTRGGKVARLFEDPRHDRFFSALKQKRTIKEALASLRNEASKARLQSLDKSDRPAALEELLSLAASSEPGVRLRAEERLDSLLDSQDEDRQRAIEQVLSDEQTTPDVQAALEALHRWAAKHRTPPGFFRQKTRPQLLEALRAPETSIYGALPTIWFFRDAGQLKRIMLTGHAYESVCSRLSSIFSHLFEEVPHSPESFLLAGAIRCDIDDSQQASDRLRKALDAHDTRFRAVVEQLLEDFPEIGDEEKREFLLQSELTRALFKRPEWILAQIVEELVRTVRDLGLARVREMSFKTHEAEEAEVRRCAPAWPGPLSEDPSRPFVVPLLDPHTGKPIEFDVPARVFNPMVFQRVVDEYGRVRRQRIIDDAFRRKRFYQETRDNFCRAYRKYYRMKKAEPQRFKHETIPIHEIVDLENATTRKLVTPEIEPASEYLDKMPAGIVRAVWWEAKMDALIADTTAGMGETVLAPCVFDALIRGWQLPFSDPELDACRRKWEEQCRPGTMFLIEEVMRRVGLQVKDVRKEQTIFITTRDREQLIVRPWYIFDPSVTKRTDIYADRWNTRRVEEVPAGTARMLADEMAQQGHWQHAIAIDDGTIASALLTCWADLVRSGDPNAATKAMNLYASSDEDPVDRMSEQFRRCVTETAMEAFLDGTLDTAIRAQLDLPELRWLRVDPRFSRLHPFLMDALMLGISGHAAPSDFAEPFWFFMLRARDQKEGQQRFFSELLADWSESAKAKPPLLAEMRHRRELYLRAAKSLDEDVGALWKSHPDYMNACVSNKRMLISPGRVSSVHGDPDSRKQAVRLWGAALVFENQARIMEQAIRRLEMGGEDNGVKEILDSLEKQATAASGRHWRQLRESVRGFKTRPGDRGVLALRHLLTELRDDILEEAEAYASHAAITGIGHQESRLCLMRLRWLRGHFRRAFTFASRVPSAELPDGRLAYPLAFAAKLAGGTVEQNKVDESCLVVRVDIDASTGLLFMDQESGENLIRISGLPESYRAQLLDLLPCIDGQYLLTRPSAQSVDQDLWPMTLLVPPPPSLDSLERLLSCDFTIASAVYFGAPLLQDARRSSLAATIVGVSFEQNDSTLREQE